MKYEHRKFNGEETGLIIELLSKENKVNILFGNVQAIRMLDEGIVQEGAYSESQIEKYRGEKIKNVVYEVTSGEFQKQIKGFADGYAVCLDLKHYIIITPSFNIEEIRVSI
ncbi:MAG: hypothetical protein KIC94_20895 [Clostridiales bacterium]|nr:hypothetical protein [Clostridiales bacterium]